MKLSVLIPHKNRATILEKTLSLYQDFLIKSGVDYEIIIVDDNSQQSDCLRVSNLERFSNIKVGYCGADHSYNMVASMTEAYKLSTGDRFLLTGAENAPANGIFIDRAIKMADDEYVVGSCLAIGLYGTLRFLSTPNEKLELCSPRWEQEDSQWYQHSIHNNRHLNFFTLISRSTWDKIGGFSPTMRQSYGFEDVDFRDRVKTVSKIVVDDSMLCYHLCHYLNGDGHYHGHITRADYSRGWWK